VIKRSSYYKRGVGRNKRTTTWYSRPRTNATLRDHSSKCRNTHVKDLEFSNRLVESAQQYQKDSSTATLVRSNIEALAVQTHLVGRVSDSSTAQLAPGASVETKTPEDVWISYLRHAHNASVKKDSLHAAARGSWKTVPTLRNRGGIGTANGFLQASWWCVGIIPAGHYNPGAALCPPFPARGLSGLVFVKRGRWPQLADRARLSRVTTWGISTLLRQSHAVALMFVSRSSGNCRRAGSFMQVRHDDQKLTTVACHTRKRRSNARDRYCHRRTIDTNCSEADVRIYNMPFRSTVFPRRIAKKSRLDVCTVHRNAFAQC
jgi:hypothetical protein